MAERLTHYTTDHQAIRNWAEQRGAQPACVRGTGNGKSKGRGRSARGMIRLDFPGYSGRESLEPISWDEWIQTFDDNNLVLIYQEQTADGQQSNFNKLISAETATERSEGEPARVGRGGRQEGGREPRSRIKGGTKAAATSRRAGTSAGGSRTSRASAGGTSRTRPAAGAGSRGGSRSTSGGRARSSSRR